MAKFGELLRAYMERTGISDSELARSVGVRRQTIFRWKEGLVAAPRNRDDVLRVAGRLRLTDEEQDRLLLAAGFAPEATDRPPAAHESADPDTAPASGTAVPEKPDAPPSTRPERRGRSPWLPWAAGAIGVILLALVAW